MSTVYLSPLVTEDLLNQTNCNYNYTTTPAGLCLTRHYSSQDEERANPDSITRQTSFDFNEIQDRDYKYFAATNDDGWLVGGGENETSFKLANPDSAHCEIMRIGTFEKALGGIDLSEIMAVMTSGKILIPHMAILPSFMLQNKDSPPEIELKFELEPNEDIEVEEWGNWQIEFVRNQLFEAFSFPGRFTPGAFHMTFVRKAAFRSPQHRAEYMEQCSEAVGRWRAQGAQTLTPETDPSQPGCPTQQQVLGEELTSPHGLYLFRHRMLPIQYFAPNFEPPYDTPEKRAVISRVLGRKWDEHAGEWKRR